MGLTTFPANTNLNYLFLSYTYAQYEVFQMVSHCHAFDFCIKNLPHRCVCIFLTSEYMCVTEQCEGIASGAKLLGVVHTVDNGAAALPGVQEVICTA